MLCACATLLEKTRFQTSVTPAYCCLRHINQIIFDGEIFTGSSKYNYGQRQKLCLLLNRKFLLTVSDKNKLHFNRCLVLTAAIFNFQNETITRSHCATRR